MSMSRKASSQSQPYLLSVTSHTSVSGASANGTLLPLINSESTDKAAGDKARNLSIAGSSDRFPKITRKVPLKSFSMTVNRKGSPDDFLPDFHKNTGVLQSPESVPPRKPKRNPFHATEKGKSDLLPMISSESSETDQWTASSISKIRDSYKSSSDLIKSKGLSESISKAWSVSKGLDRSRSSEELPLHYNETRRGSDGQKASLRSRRSRTTSYDRDDFDNIGNGYNSMDDHNGPTRISRSINTAAHNVSSWLLWNTNNSNNNYLSDASTTRKQRRNYGQDSLLPMIIPSTGCGGSVHGGRRSFQSFTRKASRTHWIQTLIVLVATYLVWHSYQRTQTIQSRLELFHDKESMSLLHLKTVEKQLYHLHENFARLKDVAINSGSNNSNEHSGHESGMGSRKEAVDSDLIRVQTQQLKQMEEELDHELRALQSKLQQVARSSIVSTYGEGPVQVIFDLDFQDSSTSNHNSISILLWYDTPHAAWTWINQIRKGIWQNAGFRMGKGAISIEASPNEEHIVKKDSSIDDDSSLKFVEKSKKLHEPWTVGLTQTDNGLQMFINLQDNTSIHKHDVCVGKVVDGFDALQRLVDTTRNNEGSNRVVTIKNAMASHLTRSQTQGVM